ncbi:uncharacterized protein G2W53_024176 [Senna tora]|uniref:Uncharacterized protein n=1 Tax=Senna tora TaxID=362788 RepID=A0A834WGQ5_9FABA|nr:uncharacterized protein G2W53_024176 [Senna tora]
MAKTRKGEKRNWMKLTVTYPQKKNAEKESNGKPGWRELRSNGGG